ncbi:MAG: hypothetical protein JW838_03210 [Spirochaetes bacterium]|nr:hypothetical protein [Spirochaetota bacterium]
MKTHRGGHRRRLLACCAALIAASAMSACSLDRTAVKLVANALASGAAGSSFSSDDDPELVGDAVPFALKLYESLLDTVTDNPDLYLSAGSGYVMYANAWVQTPADMLPDSEFSRKREQTARARRLYLRGRDYTLRGIEVRHPGFMRALENDAAQAYFETMKGEDVPFLYWAAAGWIAAWAADPFDVETGIGVKKAAAMMEAALRIDEAWDEGSLHEFFLLYYGALPESMGGSEEKARRHFDRAVALSKGKRASPYVALASTVSVKNQNEKEFVELLNRALAIDVKEKYPGRLANVIAQRRARWLLEHRGDRFLGEE